MTQKQVEERNENGSGLSRRPDPEVILKAKRRNYKANDKPWVLQESDKWGLLLILLVTLLITLSVFISSVVAQDSNHPPDMRPVFENILSPSHRFGTDDYSQVFLQVALYLEPSCSSDLPQAFLNDLSAIQSLNDDLVVLDNQLFMTIKASQLIKLTALSCVEEVRFGRYGIPEQPPSDLAQSSKKIIHHETAEERNGLTALTGSTGLIQGAVTAESGGANLDNISGYVKSFNGSSWQTAYTAHTNAVGQYVVSDVPAVIYWIWFSDFGGAYLSEYYDNAVDIESATDVTVIEGEMTGGIDVALAEAGRISGTVTAEAGGSLQGNIGVCARFFDGDSWLWFNCKPVDANGYYELGGLPTGAYRVQFYESNHLYLTEYYDDHPDVESADDILVTAGNTTADIDASLAEAGHISGTVTAAEGIIPADTVFATAYRSTGSGWQWMEIALVDANGEYDIGNLPAGTYRVEFFDNSYNHLTEYYDEANDIESADDVIVAAGNTTEGIDAVLVKGGHISGTITAGEGGEPLEGIYVCAWRKIEYDFEFLHCRSSDADGQYDINLLPSGDYRVGVNLLYNVGSYAFEFYDDIPFIFTATDVSVTAGNTTSPVDAALAEAGHISGTVTSAATGFPVSEIEACAWFYTDWFVPEYIFLAKTICDFTDANGNYVISGLPSGTFMMEFVDPNRIHVDRKVDHISVTAGSMTANIDAALAKETLDRWSMDFGYSQGWRLDKHVRETADVNNDDLADVIGFGSYAVFVSTSDGSSFGTPTSWIRDFTYGQGWRVEKHVRTVADVNGDGMGDIVGFGANGVFVSLSNGSSFGAPTKWSTEFGYLKGWRVEKHLRKLADVNGDGKVDIVGFGASGTFVALSNGSSFAAPVKWSSEFGYLKGWTVDRMPREVADVDGDGKADIVGFGGSGTYVALSNGSSFGAPVKWIGDFGFNQGWSLTEHVRELADVNADGLADIVGFGDAAVYTALSTGSNFSTKTVWTDEFTFNGGWLVDRHPQMLADHNGDGREDIASFGDDGVYVLLSPGNFANGFSSTVGLNIEREKKR